MGIHLQSGWETAPIFQSKKQVKFAMTSPININFLPKPYFLEQLQREKRRVDRSKASLSLALFHFDTRKGDELSDVTVRLKPLKNIIRETDIPGYLDKDVIGIILTDTDEKGAQEFEKRIIDRYNDSPPFTIITATYPDWLFLNLLSENQDRLDFIPLLFNDSSELYQFRYLLKRSMDIIGALSGILLLSPLMLITALAIKATSSGPVIFKQIRIGRKGFPFVFYKFRSMYCNMDDKIHRDYVSNLIQGNLDKINQGSKDKPLYKIKSDPRITRVGKFIRKTSIDELPQLFNVLKGDMSLVGPRPPLPYEVEKYKSWHLRRVLDVKPGITGLWQVDGRSVSSFDDMVRFDIRYIMSWSLKLDILILFKTIREVFRSNGAV